MNILTGFILIHPDQIQFDETEGTYFVDENMDGMVDYYLRKPDFTVSEFLHNFVVRWEFLPGSTAYLVWSQQREYSTDDGVFDLGHTGQ